MGTWLATIRFPDSTVLYTTYSTVTGSVSAGLHPSMYESYGRNLPYGGSLPRFPDRPLSPAGELILVVVEHEPDRDSWHALYCPNRAQLVGPDSDFSRYEFQERYDLIRDDDGLRHLCRYAGPRSECGRDLDGEPLGLYHPTWPGKEAEGEETPPAPDLFALWDAPDLCRRCLLTWLTRPGDNPEGGADVREPSPRRAWWRFGR
ncbi:MAG TPA: hypothetical protein VN408_20940 [Actinoplanes sp.]|nr:hypothetical protein [Actinoplanes sp.]